MSDPNTGPALEVQANALLGRTGRYEKRVRDLEGLFLDRSAYAEKLGADPDRLVYYVDEFRPSGDTGDLITGISTLLAGRVGNEFHMTRGHIHAKSDRTEIYHCISGHGLMLMETLDGRTVVTEMWPGTIAYVPPNHIHRSVNIGNADLRTIFCYPADAGQDYEIIARSGGMRHRVVDDGNGWKLVENRDYVAR